MAVTLILEIQTLSELPPKAQVQALRLSDFPLRLEQALTVKLAVADCLRGAPTVGEMNWNPGQRLKSQPQQITGNAGLFESTRKTSYLERELHSSASQLGEKGSPRSIQ